jgi:histidinol phosphatase-like enzyme (inositol monophosphatase family)
MTDFASFALRLAAAARAQTLPRWAEAGAAVNKAGPGGYDPVTEADVEAERAIRAIIVAEHPDHGIVGEEFGVKAGAGRWAWSLDPVDGTRAFVCGLPSWTTLIALLDGAEPVLGVIDAPRMDELYLGDTEGTRLIGGSDQRRLRVSGCARLSEARLATTDPHLFDGAERDGFERLRSAARLTRYGFDAYAYARLAAGSLDLVVESGLKPWDWQALVPVIRGAGGMVGNWRGQPDWGDGRIVAAASAALFEEAVAITRSCV